jgi:hypothetical protein
LKRRRSEKPRGREDEDRKHSTLSSSILHDTISSHIPTTNLLHLLLHSLHFIHVLLYILSDGLKEREISINGRETRETCASAMQRRGLQSK